MKAVVFAGEGEVRVDEVPEPVLVEDDDAIVKVSLASICGSDLHLLDGKTPGMRVGSVIGHEFIGAAVEVGSTAARVPEGVRVVGSFLIACGNCSNCAAGLFNHCSERRALGLGSLTGDLDGAQAAYVRVPHAHVNLRVLDGALAGLSDEEALFGGDILATGYYAATLAGVGAGSSAVVVGAGPIGLLTAMALAERGVRVLSLDTDPNRVEFARTLGLEAIPAPEEPEDAVREVLGDLADVSVDAVGSVPAFKSALRCTRDAGRVVIVGVYGAERFEFPMGRVWIRGLDLRFAGMTNVHAHWDDALMQAAKGAIEPARLITHRLSLDDAVEGYELFATRQANKVVLKP